MCLVPAEQVEAERAAAVQVEDHVDGTPDRDSAQAHRQAKQRIGGEAHSCGLLPHSGGAKTRLSRWCLELDLHVVHSRAGRPAPAPRYQGIDGVRRSFEDRFDRSVRKVADVARDAA